MKKHEKWLADEIERIKGDVLVVLSQNKLCPYPKLYNSVKISNEIFYFPDIIDEMLKEKRVTVIVIHYDDCKYTYYSLPIKEVELIKEDTNEQQVQIG